MATTAYPTLTDASWTALVVGAAESQLTSDKAGFWYAFGTSAPTQTFGHVGEPGKNEPIVTVDGETLYGRAISGSVTIALTSDA
jgi:hypothetical protein